MDLRKYIFQFGTWAHLFYENLALPFWDMTFWQSYPKFIWPVLFPQAWDNWSQISYRLTDRDTNLWYSLKVSSLHWLDLGFLYAFFVQWSILGLSNAFYLWHHKSACGKLMISFKGLHIFYLLCQKWSFFVREKTHRCVVLSWLITLDRTYKLSSLDYISAHSQNHYSPVQSPWRSTTEIVDLLHMCVF